MGNWLEKCQKYFQNKSKITFTQEYEGVTLQSTNENNAEENAGVISASLSIDLNLNKRQPSRQPHDQDKEYCLMKPGIATSRESLHAEHITEILAQSVIQYISKNKGTTGLKKIEFANVKTLERQLNKEISNTEGDIISFEDFKQFFTKLQRAYKKKQTFQNNIETIQDIAQEAFMGYKLIEDAQLTNLYNFDDFLSHICFCFYSLSQHYKAHIDQSNDYNSGAMSSILDDCIVTKKINLLECIYLCQIAEKHQQQISFDFLSAQLIRIFHNPTKNLRDGFILMSSLLESSLSEESALAYMKELIEKVDNETRIKIVMTAKKFLLSPQTWNLMHFLNDCKAFEEQEKIMQDDINRKPEDQNSLLKYAKEAYTVYILGSKPIYEMPFFFMNHFGLIDFKGNTYLNESFFPLTICPSQTYPARTLVSALTLCHLHNHVRLIKTDNGRYNPLKNKPFVIGIESGCFFKSRYKWLDYGKSLADVTDKEAEEILESDDILTSLTDLASRLNMIPAANPTTSTENDI